MSTRQHPQTQGNPGARGLASVIQALTLDTITKTYKDARTQALPSLTMSTAGGPIPAEQVKTDSLVRCPTWPIRESGQGDAESRGSHFGQFLSATGRLGHLQLPGLLK